MAEKQYRLNKWGTRLLKDNRPLFDWFNDSDEIVDLLNELNDKCEFLEIENEALEDGATKYAELYYKSLKENEQLKKQKEYLERKIQRERTSAMKEHEKWEKEAETKIKELSEENEQLRKESYGNLDGLNYYQEQNGHLSERLSDLEEENEQLKSEIEKLSYANEDLLSEKRNWQRMSDEYCKLSEENEQLKKENKELENEIEKLENRLWNCQNVR